MSSGSGRGQGTGRVQSSGVGPSGVGPSGVGRLRPLRPEIHHDHRNGGQAHDGGSRKRAGEVTARRPRDRDGRCPRTAKDEGHPVPPVRPPTPQQRSEDRERVQRVADCQLPQNDDYDVPGYEG